MTNSSRTIVPNAFRESPRILVVGDVMLDRYLVGSTDRVSPEAPVPVLRVKDTFHRPGGAGNVAANIVAMGGTPELVAIVGADAAGRQLTAALDADGIACAGLTVSAAAPTCVKTRLLAGHQQIARFDVEAALVDPDERGRVLSRAIERLPHADIVVISDYAKGVCDRTVCRGLIEAAICRGVPVIVDPKGSDYGRYAGATVLTPNRSEAVSMVGFPIHGPDDALRAGRMLRDECGIGNVVVTLGEQGMAVVTAEEAAMIPGRARQVYDVTGAGDSVVAALAVALGRGIDLLGACAIANAAAGLKVTRVGASKVTWQEALAMLEPMQVPRGRKIVNRTELQAAIGLARSAGKRIGFTNGCFDILHHGHVALLEAAARECDVLVVAVNSDASVARLKGTARPFVPSAERQEVVAALASVAWVCEFDEDTPLELIDLIQPDVLVKGADYGADRVVGAEVVLARGGRVITPLFVPDVSTTRIADHIRRATIAAPADQRSPAHDPAPPS